MTIDSIEELEHLESDYERAEYLQALLIAHSTGDYGDNEHYKFLRQYFLDNLSTKDLLPDWVREKRELPQFWFFIKSEFSTYAERRNFIYDEFSPILDYFESSKRLPAEKIISQRLQQFDEGGIQFAWQKALERKENDPEGAITLSRTILESVCKYILDDLSVYYDPKKTDLPKLYKLTAKELNLSPGQHSEQVFKQILGGCSAIVEGLGSVRNKLSDAHGQGKKPVKPAPRHAELAVNLAGSMALFIVETYNARKTISSTQ